MTHPLAHSTFRLALTFSGLAAVAMLGGCLQPRAYDPCRVNADCPPSTQCLEITADGDRMCTTSCTTDASCPNDRYGDDGRCLSFNGGANFSCWQACAIGRGRACPSGRRLVLPADLPAVARSDRDPAALRELLDDGRLSRRHRVRGRQRARRPHVHRRLLDGLGLSCRPLRERGSLPLLRRRRRLHLLAGLQHLRGRHRVRRGLRLLRHRRGLLLPADLSAEVSDDDPLAIAD